MTSPAPAPTAAPPAFGLGSTLLFAAGAGLSAANLYLAQPLVGLISRALDLRPDAAGFVVTVSQLGYAAGLLLLAPLGDLVENRRLICTVLLAAAGAECVMGLAPSPAVFFAAAFAVGLCSVGAQMLVALAANLAPDHSRGRAVGNVMSGLMFGILFARPLSSLIAFLGGWRPVFFSAGAAMALLVLALRRGLPPRRPAIRAHYGAILASLGALFVRHRVLRRRALYQFLLFGAFSLFWTAVPLLLEAPPFNLTQRGLSLFALAGAAGAIVAPLAGRLADRGHLRAGSVVCMLTTAAGFLVARLGGIHGSETLLVLAAILVDAGVTGNLILGQRSVFALAPEARNRLNALFIAIFFLGGAAGSALAGWAFARGAWSLVTLCGLGAPLLALFAFATDLRRPSLIKS